MRCQVCGVPVSEVVAPWDVPLLALEPLCRRCAAWSSRLAFRVFRRWRARR